jgi:hypothetical protein
MAKFRAYGFAVRPICHERGIHLLNRIRRNDRGRRFGQEEPGLKAFEARIGYGVFAFHDRLSLSCDPARGPGERLRDASTPIF